MSENPRDWKNLNWVKNHARFYFSAAQLGHPEQPGYKKRDTFEVLKPAQQCKKALESMDNLQGLPGYHTNLNLKIGSTECYISGFKISEPGGRSMVTPGGHQCEHILTVSTISMLTGLPSPIYESECNEILDELKGDSDMDKRYDDFKTNYKHFQGELWPLLYDWSLPVCNEFKDNHPFLKINFRLKGLTIKPLHETRDNIKKLLGILFFSNVDDDDETKLSKFRSQVMDKQLPEDENLEQYVIHRLVEINKKLMLIESKLKGYNGLTLKHFSYLSTKTMLNVIINNVLQHGPFKWVKPLHRMFKKTSSKLKEYIERESDTKLKISMNKFMNYTNRQNGGGPDSIIYYDVNNLPIDVIYGALMLLTMDPENSNLFSDMGIDSMMIDLHGIDIDEYMDMSSDNEELHKFKQFCNFFRYYINLENSIKYTVNSELYNRSGLNEDIVNRNFKMDVISITNYIWNLYSSYYDLEEAVMDGSSDTMDKLRTGPELDEYASEYMDILHIIKLLESMGNELKDEAVSSKRKLPPGLKKSLKKRTKRKKPVKLTDKLVNKPVNKPMNKDTNQSMDMDKELITMKFMIGDKELLF